MPSSKFIVFLVLLVFACYFLPLFNELNTRSISTINNYDQVSNEAFSLSNQEIEYNRKSFGGKQLLEFNGQSETVQAGYAWNSVHHPYFTKKKPLPEEHFIDVSNPFLSNSLNINTGFTKIEQGSIDRVPGSPITHTMAVNWRPLWPSPHRGNGNAVMALASGYSKNDFMKFVGSLRRTGYNEDIILAVSPKMDEKTRIYLQEMEVIAYPFEVDCGSGGRLMGRLNCQFLVGDITSDSEIPVALIRYALYLHWVQHYSSSSYIFLFDFRDTVFQWNPFTRVEPNIDIFIYAENHPLKKIGTCPFNGGWVRSCWGNSVFNQYYDNPVVCSGSTLGTRRGIEHYIRKMLAEVEKSQCHLHTVVSDQGYHNYLTMTKAFEFPFKVYPQGEGLVNTLGAMHGKRAAGLGYKIGDLGKYWKLRDAQGFVLNYDGSRSAVLHQWDRFNHELTPFVEKYLACDTSQCYDKNKQNHFARVPPDYYI